MQCTFGYPHQSWAQWFSVLPPDSDWCYASALSRRDWRFRVLCIQDSVYANFLSISVAVHDCQFAVPCMPCYCHTSHLLPVLFWARPRLSLKITFTYHTCPTISRPRRIQYYPMAPTLFFFAFLHARRWTRFTSPMFWCVLRMCAFVMRLTFLQLLYIWSLW